MIIPNKYQEEALKSLSKLREEHFTKSLVQLPTSTGKTFLAVMDTKQMNSEKILYLTHREHIINQACKSFSFFYKKSEIGIFKGTRKQLDKKIIIATVQSLSRNNKYKNIPKDFFDYIIMDEFHHGKAFTWEELVDWFTPKFFLGLTATPYRLDKKDILELCDYKIAYSKSFEDAQKDGFLPNITYKIITGNYEYQDSKFEEIIEENRNKKGIIFCNSIVQSEKVKDLLKCKGIYTESYHTKNSAKHNKKVLKSFDNGKIKIISCVDMLNEGLSIQDIEFVIFLRKTESPVVFWQQYGRITHTKNSSGEIYDFVENFDLCRFYDLFDITQERLLDILEDELLIKGNRKFALFPWLNVDCTFSRIDLFPYLKVRIAKKLIQSYNNLKKMLGREPSESDIPAAGKFSILSFKLLFGEYPTFLFNKKQIEKMVEFSIFDYYVKRLELIENELGRQLEVNEMYKYKINAGFFYWILKPEVVVSYNLSKEQEKYVDNLQRIFKISAESKEGANK